MEEVITALVEYVIEPRIILAHIIGFALLAGLYREGITRKKLLYTAASEELLTLLLWLAIGNSWASILALWICVSVYERILGPQVELKQNFKLFSGKRCMTAASLQLLAALTVCSLCVVFVLTVYVCIGVKCMCVCAYENMYMSHRVAKYRPTDTVILR